LAAASSSTLTTDSEASSRSATRGMRPRQAVIATNITAPAAR
jgi:hypothetical protein